MPVLSKKVVLGDKVRLVLNYVWSNLECPRDVQTSLLQKLQWQVSKCMHARQPTNQQAKYC